MRQSELKPSSSFKSDNEIHSGEQSYKSYPELWFECVKNLQNSSFQLFFFCFLLIPEITFSFNVISYYLQEAEY